MYSLQTSVIVNDKVFHITNNGDFRMVLDCFEALNDEELGEDFKVLASLIIFYDEFNDITDFQGYEKEDVETLLKEMFRFFNCGQEDNIGAQTHSAVIDWTDDAPLICAAVNNVAKTEIRALDYLHWWTFMGYYMSVGESVLSTVVSIRHKLQKHKQLEKWEKEFKRDNPQYFVHKVSAKEQKEIDDFLRANGLGR